MPSRTSSARSLPKQATIQTAFTNAKKNAGSPNSNGKPKPRPNGNILTFFKKSEVEQGLFLEERGSTRTITANLELEDDNTTNWYDEPEPEPEQRYNESGGANKKRKPNDTDGAIKEVTAGRCCTPPPPEAAKSPLREVKQEDDVSSGHESVKLAKRNGPFLEESDSEDEPPPLPTAANCDATPESKTDSSQRAKHDVSSNDTDPVDDAQYRDKNELPQAPPLLKRESTSYVGPNGFDEFDGLDDFEDDEFPDEGEEYRERVYMEEQRKLEMSDGLFEGEDLLNADAFDEVREPVGQTLARNVGSSGPSCPLCNASLAGISDQEASLHVNNCLDGNPTPLPERTPDTAAPEATSTGAKKFQRPVRAPKPGQDNPFTLGESKGTSSAFSKLMTNHAEDSAWAVAADEETKSRGKPAYKRTCPFYKILPGLNICVDAFRYGGVQGCNAYFLSHFHSDHYVGLTQTWAHGPIYCSKVTANLVRQQLGVDSKWVKPLEFEQEIEVPGTNGVKVTMIPANHCPGSSLYLFEKALSQGKNPKMQRVLHCGDFRACRAHIEHPLLRPEVMDVVSGKNRQQKIDVCYLDTTYLNPKYAFPSQEEVIKACADMCVSLGKDRADDADGYEQMKRERAGAGMMQFVRKGSKAEGEDDGEGEAGDVKEEEKVEITVDGQKGKKRGRLLVVVGTYSIGKERICLGIAKALNCKIYAPPGKQRICRALEDPELNARLTTDPREAQIHRTPLFEIRAETLDDYLKDYKDTFTRAVGFRPSGWNYRPPNSRFVESPAVQTVLYGANWKSNYSMKDLSTQRGSTSRAACFGVPYSEHSSFRELTMFCCALRIERIIPTVNVGSAKSREKMRSWCERWAMDRKKNGLFRPEEHGW